MTPKTFTIGTFVKRSLTYFAKTHLTVAAGVAAATAVIVGALVVGDSVRGSLRGLVLDRLGNVQAVLHARTFFDASLLESPELSQQLNDCEVVPAILLPSTSVETQSEQQLRRASQVQVIGVDDRFWKSLPAELKEAPLQLDEVALNAALANELSVSVGDEVTLRMQKGTSVPADNPLGRRDDAAVSLPRQRVAAILPDNSIGSLSLRADQTLVKNVYANLASLQDIFEKPNRINAALVLSSKAIGLQSVESLSRSLQPKLEDYGLQFDLHQRLFPDAKIDDAENAKDAPKVVYNYFQVSSEELILDSATVDALTSQLNSRSIKQPSRMLAYLANATSKVVDGKPDVANEMPYSIAMGVESESDLAIEDFTSFRPTEGEVPCWVNRWLAQQLNLAAGDEVQIDFFEPETTDGEELEVSRRLRVVGVVPITEPSKPYLRSRPARYAERPTIFNDPNMTPSVPGITDQDSISNWDLPFELTRKTRPIDDEYWNNHRLSPKLFLRYSDAASEKFFGSRFGLATSVRFPIEQSSDSTDLAGVETALRSELERSLLVTRQSKGITFLPLRAQQLKAATGTTPFDMLFLSLSFFVIIAALMLVSLLFRLGVGQRASQLGLMMAQGFDAQRVRRILLLESARAVALGSAFGIGLGLLYARAMIAGLESWWLGAISVAFLKYSFTPLSLVLGALGGGLASLLTIYWTLRKLSKQSPLSLLRGNTGESTTYQQAGSRWKWIAATFSAVGAVSLLFVAMSQSGMGRAGSFFGCGMLLLTAALLVAWQWLSTHGNLADARQTNLIVLAWSSIRRNPVRSLLSLSLLSVASFLIASMGVFQMSPDSQGYGSFDLMAESSVPIYRNLGNPEVRSSVLGDKAQRLQSTKIVSFRSRLGEDASCNNLFQVAQPTVLGVPPQLATTESELAAEQRFQWAAAARPDAPWSGLVEAADGSEAKPIPVVLDQNTAMWSLHQGAALNAITKLDYAGRTLHFRTVGLLSNSILQGRLLIGEENFKAAFPELSGYQFFLIRSGDQPQAQVMQTLESGWSDDGFDVVSSSEVLTKLLSVQNTYISAFQSLGALGLLLGTFGLAAVQLRSVNERRRELALLRAVGFAPQRISNILLLETSILLFSGMLIGILAASVALVPYILEVGPQTNLTQPLGMLVVVVLAGLLAAGLAIRAANRQPILAGLRSE